MAQDEDPILTDPATPEMARHVHDYSRFTFLLKWGAVVAAVAALLVLFIIA